MNHTLIGLVVMAALVSCLPVPPQPQHYAAAEDPDRAARREAADDTALRVQADPTYKEKVAHWSRGYHEMTIACDQRELDDSHARACETSKAAFSAQQGALRDWLVAQGIDLRDFDYFDLWPRPR